MLHLGFFALKGQENYTHLFPYIMKGHTIEQVAVEYLPSVIWNEQPLLEGGGTYINVSPIVNYVSDAETTPWIHCNNKIPYFF